MAQSLKQENPLLRTKLQAPPLRADLVARPELIARLDGGLRLRLTLISAPAGSGKSTLLSAWCAHHALTTEASKRVHVAWLALEEGDNDPARFWRYLVAAIETTQPGLLADTAALLPRLHQESEAALTELINTLFAESHEFALILDDYHLIEEQAVHENFAFLLEHLPPNVHCFMASRVDPPLPLARLRTRGQLQELRGTELRFTLTEMNAFLHQATGQWLSENEITALDTRVEGWVAGLQLMALSLRKRSDVTAFLASFNGSHRHIVDYLTDEVLDHLPNDLQVFLLQTSILERLNASLCNAVTGRADSQHILEQLEQSNLFVIPLDDARNWYRYHHLFADVLRKRLHTCFPEQPAEMHRRATIWFERVGQPGAAVEHALAGQDFVQATHLIEHEYGKLLARGEVITLMRWLNALPSALVEASVKLLMAQLWALAGVGRWAEADLCLQNVERLADETTLHDFRASLFAARASLLSGRGDTHHAESLLHQALAHTHEQNLMQRSYILLNLAMAHWANNHLELMQQTLIESWHAGRDGGHSYVALAALCSLAHLQDMWGDLGQARASYQKAQQYMEENSLSACADPVLPGADFTHQGLGALLYKINDLEGAQRHFTESSRLTRLDHDTRLIPILYLDQARLQLALGNSGEARAHLHDLEKFLEREILLAYHQPTLNVSLAQLFLAIGEREKAHAWLRDHYIPELQFYPFISIHEPNHSLAARVYRDLGKYTEALELLSKLASTAETDGRKGNLVGILTQRALTLQALGEREQAVETLARALSLGEQGGYIRTFVDEGTPLVPILLEVLARQQKQTLPKEYYCTPNYLVRLLNLLDSDVAPLATQAAQLAKQTQSELLSPRELEVLRLIASGLSNQEIAARLVIAASTLKTHINHIYSKLDARDRLQAVVRARDRGLF